jgi:hypothetical protein
VLYFLSGPDKQIVVPARGVKAAAGARQPSPRRGPEVGNPSASASTPTEEEFAEALTRFKALSQLAGHAAGKGNLTPAEAAERRRHLETIRAYVIPDTGRRPTFRQLAAATGVSSTTLHALTTTPTRRWTPCNA